MASSCIKGSTWNLTIYRTMLEWSLLHYHISFPSPYSCFFLFSLWFCFEPDLPFSACSSLLCFLVGSCLLTKQMTPWLDLLSRPPLKPRISPIFPAFCHFLDLSAVTGQIFPVPPIPSCKLSSCLSSPVTAVNVLAPKLVFRLYWLAVQTEREAARGGFSSAPQDSAYPRVPVPYRRTLPFQVGTSETFVYHKFTVCILLSCH